MTIHRVKHFPFEFVEFETGAFCGRAWIRPGEDMYDEIEAVAETHARVRGVEIDVVSCAICVDERTGRYVICGREREGLRVRPPGSPYASAFGEVER